MQVLVIVFSIQLDVVSLNPTGSNTPVNSLVIVRKYTYKTVTWQTGQIVGLMPVGMLKIFLLRCRM